MSDIPPAGVEDAKDNLVTFMNRLCELLKTLVKEPELIEADDVFTDKTSLNIKIEKAFDELQIDKPDNWFKLDTINNAIKEMDTESLQSVGLMGANLSLKMSTFDTYHEHLIGFFGDIRKGISDAGNKVKRKAHAFFTKIKDLADSILDSLGKILIPVASFIDAIAEFKEVFYGTRKATKPSDKE